MISLLQASCAHFERCRLGETVDFDPCAGCPRAGTITKAHPPAADLGAAWALRGAHLTSTDPWAVPAGAVDSEGGHAD